MVDVKVLPCMYGRCCCYVKVASGKVFTVAPLRTEVVYLFRFS